MEVDPQDHDPDRPIPYVEDARRAQLEGDGAQPEGAVDEGEGRVENIPHPAGWWERNWGWVVVAVGAGVAVVGGIAVVYYLYRRIKRLENWKREVIQRIERNSGRIDKLAKDQLFHDKKVLATEEKLVKTQRFVVDMAQRQKWPWPFNNRVHGLEEEFGLPKK